VSKLHTIVPRELLELAYRALDDAKCEIESFEKDAEWYTASQKMMDRIEQAMAKLKDRIK
jgi:ribosome-associated translation inhibitor RaiA